MSLENRIEAIEKSVQQKIDAESLDAGTLGVSISEYREIQSFVKSLSDKELITIIEQAEKEKKT